MRRLAGLIAADQINADRSTGNRQPRRHQACVEEKGKVR
jgi:hypothetical protein